MKTTTLLTMIEGDTNGALSILIFTGIALLLFFAMREIMLWYWKTNETLGYLRRIANKLDPEGAEVAPKQTSKTNTLVFWIVLVVVGVAIFLLLGRG